MTTFDATYSAEDNKLRLYASERLDSDLYQKVKDAGFKWAPKQELFVAPKWSPAREDLCIELAGTITAEQSTVIDRAEAKASRLDDLATKRAEQSTAFSAAAHRIGERFAGGQPVLVGHHSERRARKDKDQMERQQELAIKAHDAVDYWNYRAEGVERHANRKSDPRVRSKRIKTLLAELRGYQRDVNHGSIVIKLWSRVDAITDPEKRAETVKSYVGAVIDTGSTAPYGYYSDHCNGKLSDQDVIDGAIAYGNRLANSAYYQRWIIHTLNRLAFERGELGDVAQFDGEMTATILQAFARTHGAHKPKATQIEGNWLLESFVALPAHISDSKSLLLNAATWCKLMQSAGYTVDTSIRRKSTRPAKASLINISIEDAEQLQKLWNINSLRTKYGKVSERAEMSQATYSANTGTYGRCDTIELDCDGARIWARGGQEKPPAVVRVRYQHSGDMYGADRALTVTDKPTKSLPFNMPVLIAKAQAALDDKQAEEEKMRLSMLLTSCAQWVTSQRSVDIGVGMIERFIELRSDRLSDEDKAYILANYKTAFRSEALAA